MEKKINRGVIRTGETDIKVHLIDSFPNHPYHVFDDEDMTELAASIEANGLLNPIWANFFYIRILFICGHKDLLYIFDKKTIAIQLTVPMLRGKNYFVE